MLIAQPDDQDLDLRLSGVRVGALRIHSRDAAEIRFDLKTASGWWKPAGTGKRADFAHQTPELVVYLVRADGSASGYYSGTLWCLETWRCAGVPFDLCSAPGKSAFLRPAEGVIRSRRPVTLPAITPTGEDGRYDCPDPPGAFQADEETGLTVVSLAVQGDDSRTAYMRQWLISKRDAADFAGMMTFRFGEPVEAFGNTGKAEELSPEVVTYLPDPPCGCGGEHDG